MVPTWTSESLAETVWALKRLLRLVQDASPTALSPTADGYRLKVEQWLRNVEPVLRQEGESERPLSIPAFPLTSFQLGALEEAIHRVLAERLAAQKGRRGTRAREAWNLAISLSASLEYLHTTLQKVDRSSHFIIEAVASVFLLNALYLVLLIALRHHITLTTNLVVLALVGNLVLLAVIGGLWQLHDAHLQHHREVLGWHTMHHRNL